MVLSSVNVEVAAFVLPVPNNPYGVCGRKATFEEVFNTCQARGGVGVSYQSILFAITRAPMDFQHLNQDCAAEAPTLLSTTSTTAYIFIIIFNPLSYTWKKRT